MNEDDTAASFSKTNRISNAIPEATTRKTRTTARATSTRNTPYLYHTVNLIYRHRSVDDKREDDDRTITITLAKVYDRTGVSYRAAAIIASSEQEYTGITHLKSLIVFKFDEKKINPVKN